MTTYTAQPALAPNPGVSKQGGYRNRVSKQGYRNRDGPLFYITHDSRYHATPAMTTYPAQPAPAPDLPVAHLAYGYDRDSLPTYREDLQAQANTQKYDELYGRDGLNRLDNYQRGELVITGGVPTMPTTPTFQQDWALDQVANWTGFKEDNDGSGTWNLDQSRTHNKSNEITAITGGGWTAPTYDAAGNTTQAPNPSKPTVVRANQNYTYDAWNRLVKVTNSVAGNPTLAQYTYDARGFRITKKEYTTPGTHDATRDYYYTSSWQCIEERVTDVATSTTTLNRQYIWGLRYIDDLIRRDRDTTGNGTLDEQLYALTDRQFNIIALWDKTAGGGSGAIVERITYDPYGQPQFLNENFTPKSATTHAWNALFQGLHRDEETSLYNNRARILHPTLGRFLQRDPLGYPDGLNAYAAYHVLWAGVDAYGLTTNVENVEVPGLLGQTNALAVTYVKDGLIEVSIALDLTNHPSESNCCVAKLVEEYLNIVTAIETIDGYLLSKGIQPANATRAQRASAEQDLNTAFAFEVTMWQTGYKGIWNIAMRFLDMALQAIQAGDCPTVAMAASAAVNDAVEEIATGFQKMYDDDRRRVIANAGNADAPNVPQADPNWGERNFDNNIDVRIINTYG